MPPRGWKGEKARPTRDDSIASRVGKDGMAYGAMANGQALDKITCKATCTGRRTPTTKDVTRFNTLLPSRGRSASLKHSRGRTCFHHGMIPFMRGSKDRRAFEHGTRERTDVPLTDGLCTIPFQETRPSLTHAWKCVDMLVEEKSSMFGMQRIWMDPFGNVQSVRISPKAIKEDERGRNLFQEQ